MLSTEQLRAIQICPEALQLVPERVARQYGVLPASAENGQLRLILPDVPNDQLGALKEKLQFLLGCTFAFDTASATALTRLVDLHYTAAYSTIQNCDRAFRIRCPKNWADLTPTDDPAARWCSTCERTVTFCMSDADIERLTRSGQCIAYYDDNTQTDTLGMLEESDA